MSLQRRLTLFFVLIVILPLAAGGFVVQRVVVKETERRAVEALTPALNGSILLYNTRAGFLRDAVAASVADPVFARALASGRSTRIRSYLARVLSRSSTLDFLLVQNTAGRVVGFAAKPGDFVPGFERPGADEILGAATGDGFTRSTPVTVRIPGRGNQGAVMGGFWLDKSLLGTRPDNVDISLVADGKIVASTLALPGPIPIDTVEDAEFIARIGEPMVARAHSLPGGMTLVASNPTSTVGDVSRRVTTSILGLLALAIVGTTVLAYVLARLITQPLEHLAEGAVAVSEGRFDYRMPVKSKDEFGQLATAFNNMTERLREMVAQLSSSRDQLQRAVHRIGQALRSTHDMDQMLDAILKTSLDAVAADAAVLWRFTPTRHELYPALAAGMDTSTLKRVGVGEGIVGFVAERPGIVRASPGAGPQAAPGEPWLPIAMAVPLYTQNHIYAVLGTYRRVGAPTFSEDEMDTLNYVADTGGVAIDNVLLHEQAQRWSLTDGLTSAWNLRYFKMQFKQVLATAKRFKGRNFSILMMDLDGFKQVNDTYGHQRGDQVLVEFSDRARKALREVDTFARYGGEEFVCLLSETELSGAITTAEKIRNVVRSEPFGAIGDHPIYITLSIGVATYPQHGDSLESLIEKADTALLTAKRTGKDRVCIAGEGVIQATP